ncbi:hypothetical protein [Kitasatospora sp. NPDC089509]|uniref:hypothetical protein n=1 Tax=Kitasatospora sp. NPDC089509 TaxID=3364079 RepID=UPI00382C26D1
MPTYHLDLGPNGTEALESVTKLALVDTDVDFDTFVTGDFKAPIPLWGNLLLTRGDVRDPDTTKWAEGVENTDTHQDVVLIVGDPTDPKAHRVRLVDAWASVTYHLDEDDDPDAFAISFKDIAVEK